MSTESMKEASHARLTDLQIAEQLVEQATLVGRPVDRSVRTDSGLRLSVPHSYTPSSAACARISSVADLFP